MGSFKLGSDSIVGKYNDNKPDKSANCLAMKNLYANPLDCQQCYQTGVGIYAALRGEAAFEQNSRLILTRDCKEKTALTRYYKQLNKIAKRHTDELAGHIIAERFSPDGLRKGVAM